MAWILKMVKRIRGNRYYFEIEERRGEFKILAVDRETRRCSSICNLNAMLANLGVNYGSGRGSSRFEDSSWLITPEGARRLFERAVSCLSDKEFRAYIERNLDDDRSAGEWENVFV